MAFEFPIRIYWEDTDAGGIVFYANYLKFMERGRTEWLRSLGLEQQHLREQVGGMFVVSEAHIKYLQPARLDDELIVTAELQEAGRASMQIAQRVLLKQKQPTDTPQLLCEGTIRIGWVDALSMRPARIPQSLIQTIS
ncbi:tol-pal system-associated acyl-CoA thioesterase [Comamonas sp. MYb21]|uniref:tol-pal system-associated acyl-CoA thioesterase n=1 Tax=unclassified Comamonas TaxID=2638500 RepID=UPI0030A5CE82